ncbi:MAG TPA: class I adenylate-forming enzyme family protein [Mycobacteriales bacterium]|nr:class I adenylate-forming enzyme family protein [Mycobacteriales bacterium]
MSLTLLLDLAVGMVPDRVAVGRRHDGITFADLDRRARNTAAHLQTSQARTLAYVGLSGPAFHVSLFAAAHAGVAVAPLNYRLSDNQLADLLGQLDAPLVVADEAFLSHLPSGVATITTTGLLALPEAEPEWVDVDDDSPAVLLFTSGTTSAPKGVILRHAHLVAYVLQTVDPGSALDDDAALVSVPPYHVAGVGTVLTNTAAGRRVVHLPDFSAENWLDILTGEGITSAMVVPTMLSRIVDHLDGAEAKAPTLRSIAYGGARVSHPVLAAALNAFPETGFVNAYGLTETSSTIALLDADDHRAALASEDPAVQARLSSAGKLIPGIEAQVRDEDDGVLAAGEAGELWVRGPQVSGEYLGSGSVVDGDGWFPTRDRAWIDADGYLFIEGRSDDTIIRGGENIAPAEVEDVLVEHPDVHEVAVVGVPDDEWGECIVAVVVPHREVDPEELRAFARKSLRGSRTPDRIVFRDELPVTATGKLLRRVLVDELTSD